MTPKEYLSRARGIEGEIQQLERMRRAAYEQATRCTASVSHAPAHGQLCGGRADGYRAAKGVGRDAGQPHAPLARPAGRRDRRLSAEDVAFFIESGEEYSKASDNLYEYIMRRTSETVERPADMVYNRFKEIEKTDVLEMKWNGAIDPDIDGYHETMKILSQELKFDYERKKKD